jgi:hypothetical protein
MHPAAEFQLERVAREFAQWRAVPEAQRSPAPAWSWQPAFEAREQPEEMSPVLCHHLELPVGSTYAAGVAVLMAALADQTSLPWPDEFPVGSSEPTNGRTRRELSYLEGNDANSCPALH